MVLIVAIIGMIIIMVRERNRVLVIETEAQTIHRVQHNGNIVQHHITILSTYGETALSWKRRILRTIILFVCISIPCCRPCTRGMRNLSAKVK